MSYLTVLLISESLRVLVQDLQLRDQLFRPLWPHHWNRRNPEAQVSRGTSFYGSRSGLNFNINT